MREHNARAKLPIVALFIKRGAGTGDLIDLSFFSGGKGPTAPDALAKVAARKAAIKAAEEAARAAAEDAARDEAPSGGPPKFLRDGGAGIPPESGGYYGFGPYPRYFYAGPSALGFLPQTGAAITGRILDEVEALKDKVKPPVGLDFVRDVAAQMARDAAVREKKADAAVGVFAGAVSLANPVLGAAVSGIYAAWKGLGRAIYGAGGDSDEQVQRLERAYKRTIDRGFPPLWSIFAAANTASAAGMADVVEGMNAAYDALTIDDQEAVHKWWGYFLYHIKDPAVVAAYKVLRFNGEPTDEDVVLIATPIAVHHGLNLRTFAAKVWDASPGWRDGPTPGGPQQIANIARTALKLAKRDVPVFLLAPEAEADAEGSTSDTGGGDTGGDTTGKTDPKTDPKTADSKKETRTRALSAAQAIVDRRVPASLAARVLGQAQTDPDVKKTLDTYFGG